MSLVERLLARISRWSHRFLMATSRSRSCWGMVVYGEDERDFAPVVEGIELLREVDSLRFQRARREVPVIVCVPGETYLDVTNRALYLNTREYAEPFGIALVLVHVAAAGVLLRRFPKKGPSEAAGLRICTREQEVVFRKASVLYGLSQEELEGGVEALRRNQEAAMRSPGGCRDRYFVLRDMVRHARGRG